ncbi:MAG: hypothetical protein Q7W13_10205 [Bacteroidia bacterium]|nr:hypothetical protein [Bacteroidia bacterium]
MKKVTEMKIAKEAILSEMEASTKGGVDKGSTTNYVGPSQPRSLTTYVDGNLYGADGSSGSLYGDSWAAVFNPNNAAGALDVITR